MRFSCYIYLCQETYWTDLRYLALIIYALLHLLNKSSASYASWKGYTASEETFDDIREDIKHIFITAIRPITGLLNGFIFE